MLKVTRRSFVTAVGAVTIAPVCGFAVGAALRTRRPRARGYLFFEIAEARFVEAACARLIPRDGAMPGALDAGVPYYVDGQLAGAWGAGRELHRGGSWQPGTALPVDPSTTPADYFRTALRAVERHLGERGVPFARLSTAEQDGFLAALASGVARLDGIRGAVFFDMLLTMTLEGFFGHPQFGASRDRVAWGLVGSAGAHAASILIGAHPL